MHFFSKLDVMRLCHRSALSHPLLGVVVYCLVALLAVYAQVPVLIAPRSARTGLEHVMHLQPAVVILLAAPLTPVPPLTYKPLLVACADSAQSVHISLLTLAEAVVCDIQPPPAKMYA